MEFRFILGEFPLELASDEQLMLRVNSVLRIRPDRSPDVVVVPGLLSPDIPRRVCPSRSEST